MLCCYWGTTPPSIVSKELLHFLMFPGNYSTLLELGNYSTFAVFRGTTPSFARTMELLHLYCFRGITPLCWNYGTIPPLRLLRNYFIFARTMKLLHLCCFRNYSPLLELGNYSTFAAVKELLHFLVEPMNNSTFANLHHMVLLLNYYKIP